MKQLFKNFKNKLNLNFEKTELESKILKFDDKIEILIDGDMKELEQINYIKELREIEKNNKYNEYLIELNKKKSKLAVLKSDYKKDVYNYIKNETEQIKRATKIIKKEIDIKNIEIKKQELVNEQAKVARECINKLTNEFKEKKKEIELNLLNLQKEQDKFKRKVDGFYKIIHTLTKFWNKRNTNNKIREYLKYAFKIIYNAYQEKKIKLYEEKQLKEPSDDEVATSDEEEEALRQLKRKKYEKYKNSKPGHIKVGHILQHMEVLNKFRLDKVIKEYHLPENFDQMASYEIDKKRKELEYSGLSKKKKQEEIEKYKLELKHTFAQIYSQNEQRPYKENLKEIEKFRQDYKDYLNEEEKVEDYFE